MQNVLPTAADVAEAHLRIRDWIVETPVLESDALSRRIGTRVLLKAECLQRGGSFKIRGALNRPLQLSHAERSAGVVAFSSGNHAKAVAIAAQWLDCRATIVMPHDAPRAKLDGTRAYGAEIVLYDRERDDREAIAARLAAERGAALVPPFDHARDRGQGTAALELAVRSRWAPDPRRPLRTVQRRRSRRRLGARDQVPVPTAPCCRRAGRLRGSRIRCARVTRRRASRDSCDGLRARRSVRSPSRSTGASSRASSLSMTMLCSRRWRSPPSTSRSSWSRRAPPPSPPCCAARHSGASP